MPTVLEALISEGTLPVGARRRVHLEATLERLENGAITVEELVIALEPEGSTEMPMTDMPMDHDG